MIEVSKLKLWILRLLLFIYSGICLYIAGVYWEKGIRYVSETSSNPNPSEAAKLLGPPLMKSSEQWLMASGVIFAIFLYSIFLRSKKITDANPQIDATD